MGDGSEFQVGDIVMSIGYYGRFKIEIAGSSKVTAPKLIKTNKLTLDVAGSGQITLAQLECGEFKTDVAGSGSIVTGPVQATTVKTDIAGSGKVEVAALVCIRPCVSVAGTRCTRCTPLSYLSVPYTSAPLTAKSISL